MIDFFRKLFTTIGQDGLLHFALSALLVLVAGWLCPLWFACLAVLLIGGAKELVWDKWLKKGTPEWKDLACDAAGIAVGALVVMLYFLKLKG